MKYCEEYAVLIQDALDGELPAEERQRLEEHLEQCPGCRAYYEAMRAIDESFSDMDAQPPRRLHESIMQAVAETPQQKKRAFPGWQRFTLAAAALALVVFLGCEGFLPGIAGLRRDQSEECASEDAVPEGQSAWEGLSDSVASQESGDVQPAQNGSGELEQKGDFYTLLPPNHALTDGGGEGPTENGFSVSQLTLEGESYPAGSSCVLLQVSAGEEESHRAVETWLADNSAAAVSPEEWTPEQSEQPAGELYRLELTDCDAVLAELEDLGAGCRVSVYTETEPAQAGVYLELLS